MPANPGATPTHAPGPRALARFVLAACALSLVACVHHRERKQREQSESRDRALASAEAPPAQPAAPETPPAPPAPAGDRFERLLVSGDKLYSQHDEELIIRHFFRDRKDGFFLDVGCYHYREMSTTFFLEKHLGWSGIGVDALPYLEAEYVEHRPRTRFFNYIVTDHSGTIETFYASGPVSSANKEWTEESPEVKVEKQEIKVRTITLDELLEMNEVESIDFLSMDIEGGEPDALKGFDVEKYRPELVCIEVGNSPNGKFIQGYFERHGYRLIERYLEHDMTNRYYTPRDR
jgi:FkbM family methyltransferase